jgi:hypothetical protein
MRWNGDVVRHQNIGMNPAIILTGNFFQSFKVTPIVFIREKTGLAVVLANRPLSQK